ncbi:MAG: transposase domain-containing protein [Bacteroidota bacterium]
MVRKEGSITSAKRAASYLSFFFTCRLNNVNPISWIMDVFEKNEHLKPSHYHTLFPQNWGK